MSSAPSMAYLLGDRKEADHQLKDVDVLLIPAACTPVSLASSISCSTVSGFCYTSHGGLTVCWALGNPHSSSPQK